MRAVFISNAHTPRIITTTTKLKTVPCGPPGIGAEFSGGESQNSFRGTYFVGSVAFKRAVVDLQSALMSINGSTLEVACAPPESGAEQIRKISQHSSRA
jgi:hypothetical protein